MKKKAGFIIMGVVLFAAFWMGNQEKGEVIAAADTVSAGDETQKPEETAPAVSAEPATGPSIDVSKITINKKKIIIKAGKKCSLVIQNTTSPIVWTSDNPKVAKVTEKGVVKGVKKGKTVVKAAVDGITLSCNVTVVDKMSKKDFGKFSGENFVAYCQRMGYNGGYAWKGQWKGNSKKRSTYRKIKIGATKAKVEKAYGDFTLTKCKSKDPFTKMKGLKKNKVKYYNDEVWGRYRIRFYYNSKKKVVAIILACNIEYIKKKDLKTYL